VALLWKPLADWSFRASYGTSFRVANLIQSLGVSGGLPNIVDPVTGRVGFVTSRLVGNPNLAPEDAKTYNFGLSYRGREGWLDGFSVDLDYWRFNYQDLIVKQNEQALVNADAACGGCMSASVIRSNGAVVQVRATYVNASSLETDGVDVALGYAWDTDHWGAFNATLTGTYVNSYRVQTTPTGPKISAVDNRNATNFARAIADLRFNAGLTWTLGDWQAFAGVNYVDDYGNDFFLNPATAPTVPVLVSNPRRIDSMTTVDLSLTYQVPEAVNVAGGTRLSAGVNNLFNEDPPVVQDYGGFDQTTHDPRGRIVWLRASKDF
jgi:outer membrane receptor protein involved in Fe transport